MKTLFVFAALVVTLFASCTPKATEETKVTEETKATGCDSTKTELVTDSTATTTVSE